VSGAAVPPRPVPAVDGLTPIDAAAHVGDAWLHEVAFDAQGLVPVIAQEAGSGRVLMFAWADRAALAETVATGRAVYFSRSRRRLWRKGEESGHVQRVREVRLDCDGDVVLYTVEQVGGIACHTGRHACFFRRLDPPTAGAGGAGWTVVDPVLQDPGRFYREPAGSGSEPA